MKLLVWFFVMAFAVLCQAQDVDSTMITGSFVLSPGCIDGGYGVQITDSEVLCITFDSETVAPQDLTLGATYSFEGYQTEDGFFITSLAD